MKNYFRVDFTRLAFLLLPSALRKPLINAFVNAFCEPVKILYLSFSERRESNIYRLSITPQVCSLEKALNDRFDPAQRGIYITEGLYRKPLYIYRNDEDFPLSVYQESEDRPINLYLSNEAETSNGDFVVNVPSRVIFDINEMRALLDRYKLVTKTYSINIFL